MTDIAHFPRPGQNYPYIHMHIHRLDDLNIDLDLEGSLILIENQTFD